MSKLSLEESGYATRVAAEKVMKADWREVRSRLDSDINFLTDKFQIPTLKFQKLQCES